jgi:hypothetical protein
MHIAFIAACLLGIWVFWRRRRVDPMLLGFVSCLFYFAPALTGHIQIRQNYVVYSSDVTPDVYGILIIVVLTTIAAAWFVDRIPAGAAPALRLRYVPHVLLGMAVCAATISAFTVGRAYFCFKPAMMLSIDRWYYVAAYCAPLCFAAAAAERAWSILCLALVVLLLDSLIGFRAGLAIAGIATALIYGEASLSSGWKSLAVFVLAVLIGGFAFVAVREAMVQAHYSLRPLCTARTAEPVSLPGSPDAWPRTQSGQPIVPERRRQRFRSDLWVPMMGEPSITQATLNEVVRQRFTVDRAHLIEQLKTAIPGAWVIFGIDLNAAVTFNLLSQPVLFPRFLSGMANNPWAQAYASGGLPMVALFAAGYALGLGILTLLFRMTRGAVQAIIAVLASWWGFYGHRNDLMIEIGIMKMVLYSAAAALFIGWLLGRYQDRVGRLGARMNVHQ